MCQCLLSVAVLNLGISVSKTFPFFASASMTEMINYPSWYLQDSSQDRFTKAGCSPCSDLSQVHVSPRGGSQWAQRALLMHSHATWSITCKLYPAASPVIHTQLTCRSLFCITFVIDSINLDYILWLWPSWMLQWISAQHYFSSAPGDF